MQVLEQGESRFLPAPRANEAPGQLQEPPLARLGIHSLDRATGVGDREEIEDQRKVALE